MIKIPINGDLKCFNSLVEVIQRLNCCVQVVRWSIHNSRCVHYTISPVRNPVKHNTRNPKSLSEEPLHSGMRLKLTSVKRLLHQNCLCFWFYTLSKNSGRGSRSLASVATVWPKHCELEFALSPDFLLINRPGKFIWTVKKVFVSNQSPVGQLSELFTPVPRWGGVRFLREKFLVVFGFFVFGFFEQTKHNSVGPVIRSQRSLLFLFFLVLECSQLQIR